MIELPISPYKSYTWDDSNSFSHMCYEGGSFESTDMSITKLRNEALGFDYIIKCLLSDDLIVVERIMIKKSGYRNSLKYILHIDGSIEVLQASRALADDLLSSLKGAPNKE